MATSVLLLSWAAVARADDFPVSNTADDGAGSLRAAITAANANTGELDVVDASAVTGTINLQSTLPDLTDDIEIRGPGADQLTLRRDAGGQYRIFTISFDVEAEISGLTVANGSVADDDGGGIRSAGTLILQDATVLQNTARHGGGIFNLGTATIERTTVVGNTAVDDDGGGISNFHVMTIANSTVTGNTAASRGGGVVNNGDDVLTITNSTLARNTAADGANLEQGSRGDPLPVLLISTILAEPLGDPNNCSYAGNGQIDSQGSNLADDDTCSLDQPTDQPNGDARLDPLADNGGTTETTAPRPASDAIDQGIADGLTIDQRGLTRPFDFIDILDAVGGDAADIGAVELQADEDDVAAPETTITKRPKKKVLTDKRRIRAKFRFTGTDDISPTETLTFQCKLDRKPLKSCESPFRKRVKPGRHRFRVFSTDEVGNVDATPAKFRFKIKQEA
jgi:hypothetical protein